MLCLSCRRAPFPPHVSKSPTLWDAPLAVTLRRHQGFLPRIPAVTIVLFRAYHTSRCSKARDKRSPGALDEPRLEDSAVFSDVATCSVSHEAGQSGPRRKPEQTWRLHSVQRRCAILHRQNQEALIKRLSSHALKPNARRYNFWNYFSAFEIPNPSHRDEVEAILISAMPTANSSRPKFERKTLDRRAARMLNNVQALMLTGQGDTSGESKPEEIADDEDS